MFNLRKCAFGTGNGEYYTYIFPVRFQSRNKKARKEITYRLIRDFLCSGGRITVRFAHCDPLREVLTKKKPWHAVLRNIEDYFVILRGWLNKEKASPAPRGLQLFCSHPSASQAGVGLKTKKPDTSCLAFSL